MSDYYETPWQQLRPGDVFRLAAGRDDETVISVKGNVLTTSVGVLHMPERCIVQKWHDLVRCTCGHRRADHGTYSATTGPDDRCRYYGYGSANEDPCTCLHYSAPPRERSTVERHILDCLTCQREGVQWCGEYLTLSHDPRTHDWSAAGEPQGGDVNAVAPNRDEENET